MRFDGCVAVVTGGGRGLGREYALALAARGARVVVNDIGAELDGTGTSSGPADDVVAEIRAAGGSACPDTHSVTTDDGAGRIVATAVDTFGHLDIVVNNAGIIRDGTFHKQPPAAAQHVLDVHLNGTINVCRAAWPHLRARSYGRVVNTTSTSGLFGNFGQSAYAAAKMGVVGLTHTLALEGAKYDIAVNAVAPGAATRMAPAGVDPAALRPDLVAPVVLYLSHKCCSVSGEIFRAIGGHVSRVFVGVTRGYRNLDLTAEDVRDQIETIRCSHPFLVPASAADTMWST